MHYQAGDRRTACQHRNLRVVRIVDDFPERDEVRRLIQFGNSVELVRQARSIGVRDALVRKATVQASKADPCELPVRGARRERFPQAWLKHRAPQKLERAAFRQPLGLDQSFWHVAEESLHSLRGAHLPSACFEWRT